MRSRFGNLPNRNLPAWLTDDFPAARQLTLVGYLRLTMRGAQRRREALRHRFGNLSLGGFDHDTQHGLGARRTNQHASAAVELTLRGRYRSHKSRVSTPFKATFDACIDQR